MLPLFTKSKADVPDVFHRYFIEKINLVLAKFYLFQELFREYNYYEYNVEVNSKNY